MPTVTTSVVVPDERALPHMYVEARVGSANHRNRGGTDDPCRCVWGGNNQPADAVVAAQVVLLGEFTALLKRVYAWADPDNADAMILKDRVGGLLRTYDRMTGVLPPEQKLVESESKGG